MIKPRYSVSRRKGPEKIYYCAYCNNELRTYRQPGKYCNLQCKSLHIWAGKKVEIETGTSEWIHRSHLLRYLTERDGYSCSKCLITDWNGEYLSLDIDHRDGNHKNNHPSNLRFLCPNCHRQTETWGNKKRESQSGDCARSTS